MGLSLSFAVGAPQPAESGGAGPALHVPSGEAASLGLDPDHGVTGTVPLIDGEIPITFGDQVVPVKPVLGLTLKGWAAIAGVVLAGAVGLGVASADGEDHDPVVESTGGPVDFGDQGSDLGDSGTDAGYEGGGETTEYIEPDPVAEAFIGECYYVSGDEHSADLEWTTCGAGTFAVVDIAEGTNDLGSCDWVEDADQAVTSTAATRVLCLSYIAVDGDTAYRAQPGECVYGSNEYGAPWNVIDCETGAFRVLDRLEGQTDTSGCADDVYGAHWLTYTTSESYLDVVLCLQIVYPSDIGYAQQYACMLMSGDNYFEFVDCGAADVRVVSRTNEYEASWFCDGYGWSTWTNSDFPEHAYTVCWEWY